MIISRGIAATMLLSEHRVGEYLALIHTGANLHEVPSFSTDYKKGKFRPPFGPAKEFSICVALREKRERSLGSFSSLQVIHSNNSHPVVMERCRRSVVYCLDPSNVPSFEPRKVCLSLESRDVSTELNRTKRLDMAQHMPIWIFDPQEQHSVLLTASPVTQRDGWWLLRGFRRQ